MLTRLRALPLLVAVALVITACSSDAPTTSPKPADGATTAAADGGTATGAMATAIANLQEPPDPLNEAEATCVAEYVGEDNLAMVDNFSTAFRDEFDQATDPTDLENGEEIAELLFGAANECLDLGIDAECEDGDACEYGDDETLDGLHDECLDGDLDACDELYFTSPVGSDYEAVGETCGNTVAPGNPGSCTGDASGGDTTGQDYETRAAAIDCDAVSEPCEYGDDEVLDGYWDACEGGDLGACDDLFFESGFDTKYEAFGDTCGGRETDGEFCDPDNDA